MRTRLGFILIAVLLLCGCSPGATSPSDVGRDTLPPSRESSVGVSVAPDDPNLPRADSAGNAPADVLFAFVRAWNRSDWETVYSLMAPPKADFESWVGAAADDPVPWDDFAIHETRIVSSKKALVRVTYATIGFSSLEGVPPEEARTVVVVRDPGEWWVLEKGTEDDAVWRVTFKGPND